MAVWPSQGQFVKVLQDVRGCKFDAAPHGVHKPGLMIDQRNQRSALRVGRRINTGARPDASQKSSHRIDLLKQHPRCRRWKPPHSHYQVALIHTGCTLLNNCGLSPSRSWIRPPELRSITAQVAPDTRVPSVMCPRCGSRRAAGCRLKPPQTRTLDHRTPHTP